MSGKLSSWKPGGGPLTPLPIVLPTRPRPARENVRRNGLPETTPYVYGGTDPDRDAEVADTLAAIRRQAARNHQQRQEWVQQHLTPAQQLDVCEAVGEPGYEWRNELMDQP
jgi:hypothetical protein